MFKNVELLKTKTTYKGKDYYDFYIRMPNGNVNSIKFSILYSDKVKGSTKARIINELVLVASDYEKEEK